MIPVAEAGLYMKQKTFRIQVLFMRPGNSHVMKGGGVIDELTHGGC